MLRPVDVVVLVKILSMRDGGWSQMVLARELGVSSQTVNAGLKRAEAGRLYDSSRKRVSMVRLEAAMVHGLPIFFPAAVGPVARGVPTAWGAPPLVSTVISAETPVWPDALGEARGPTIEPLHVCVPNAVRRDPVLWEYLALADALRVGGAREVSLAKVALASMLSGSPRA